MARIARTVSEFVAMVAQKAAGAQGQLWFRGNTMRSYRLIPSLYRVQARGSGGPPSPLDLLTLEAQLITRFRERAQPYLDRPLPENDVELLVLMQHFGVPTRLLDWSESALVGLWFALERHGLSRARVWIFDPTAWNRAALSFNGYTGGVLSLDSGHLRGTRPGAPFPEIPLHPLAVAGPYNNARIVGQRGAFTFAGKSLDSLAVIAHGMAVGQGIKPTTLVDAIDVPAALRRGLYEELTALGFGRAMLYPDLTNLAIEIRDALCEAAP